MTDRHDLQLVLTSGAPIVVIQTTDEARFLEMLTDIAVSSPKAGYRPLFRWWISISSPSATIRIPRKSWDTSAP
jgi:hypothetical protein